MYAFILVIYISGLVFVAATMAKTQRIQAMLSNVGLTIGALVPVILVEILFPFLGWFLLIIWVFIFAKVARDSYHHIYEHRLTTTDNSATPQVEKSSLPTSV